MRAVDDRYDAVAATLGASPLRVFTRVALPLAAPGHRLRGGPRVGPGARRVRRDDHLRGQLRGHHADRAARGLRRPAERPAGRDRPEPRDARGLAARPRPAPRAVAAVSLDAQLRAAAGRLHGRRRRSPPTTVSSSPSSAPTAPARRRSLHALAGLVPARRGPRPGRREDVGRRRAATSRRPQRAVGMLVGGPPALPAPHRARQRGLRPAQPRGPGRAADARADRGARRPRDRASSPAGDPRSSPTARRSGWPWPGPSPRTRACSSSTSRSRPSTRRPARTSGPTLAGRLRGLPRGHRHRHPRPARRAHPRRPPRLRRRRTASSRRARRSTSSPARATPTSPTSSGSTCTPAPSTDDVTVGTDLGPVVTGGHEHRGPSWVAFAPSGGRALPRPAARVGAQRLAGHRRIGRDGRPVGPGPADGPRPGSRR